MSAAEPYEAFLDALRRERYHDLALIYLERLESRSDTTPEFRASIPYQRAMLAFAAMEGEADLAARLRGLDAAREAVDRALESTPDATQQVKLRQMRVEASAAKARLLELQWSNTSSAKATQLRDDASAQYKDAISSAEQLAADLKAKLEGLAKTPPAERDATLRENWRAAYLAAQVAVPTLRLEAASLMRENGPEYRDWVRSTAEMCRDLLEKYSIQRPDAYLPLTLLSGRCYQALEDYGKALSFYGEILENDPDVLPDHVTATATLRSMECWASRSEGKLDKAIAAGEHWLSLHPRAKPADAAPIRVALAKYLLQSAKTANNSVSPKQQSRVRGLLLEASRSAGPWRRDAQQLLATLPASSDADEITQEFATFEDAKLAGDAALGELQSTEQTISLLAMQAEQEATDKPTPEWEQATIDNQAKLQTLRTTAIAAYRRALDLIRSETAIEEVTQTQFLLAYLYYQQEEYYDALVLAEYVARERSDSAQARSSIRTAMAALTQLIEQGESSSPFAEHYLIQLAEFAARRWPNDEEGQLGVVTRVRLLVGQGKLAEAQDYMNHIPESSPWRADAEISTGLALFREYQRASSSNADGGSGAPKELSDLRQTSQALLEAGLRRVADTTVTPAIILAQLTLAQIELDRGSARAARERLEDPKYGPYALLQSRSADIADPALVESILQTALRARLLAPTEPGPANADEIVQPVLNQLVSAVGDSAGAKQRLVSTLVRLADELRGRVQSVPQEQKLAAVVGFEPILAYVVATSQDANTLNWVAHLLGGVADLFDGSSSLGLAARDRLLQLAVASLENAMKLQQASDDKKSRLQTVVRLATVKRRQQDFRGAIPLFAEVLAETPNLLNVQIEAAYTYQDGGAFQYAVKGGRPDPKSRKNVIWGWEKISTMLARQLKRGDAEREKFESLFHEARLQIARCRYLQALETSGPKREDYLQAAQRTLDATAALYPDLGGPEWKAKYESLQDEIKKALGNAEGSDKSVERTIRLP